MRRRTIRAAVAALVGAAAWPTMAFAAFDWTPASMLNTSDAPVNSAASDADEDPKLASDGQGNWVAVWHSRNSDGDKDPVFSYYNGSTWSAPQLIDQTANAVNEEKAQIAYGNGAWIVVWQRVQGTSEDIMVSRTTDPTAVNGGWSATSVVASFMSSDNDGAAADDDTDCGIASDGQGNWIATWECGTSTAVSGKGGDDDIVAVTSTDNGLTWNAPVLVNADFGTTDSIDEGNPRVASNGNGTWVIGLQSNNATITGATGNQGILMYRITDNGATWSNYFLIDTQNFAGVVTEDSDDPMVAVNGSNWIVTWIFRDRGAGAPTGTDDREIMYSRSTDDGQTWAAPLILNNGVGDGASNVNDEDPTVAADKLGTFIITWESQNGAIAGGDANADKDIVYSVSSDSGATWSAPAFLNSNAVNNAFENANPQVEFDATGSWLVAWKSADSVVGTNAGQDVLYTFATDTDGDGIADFTDASSATAPGADTDGDTTPNYQDTTTDTDPLTDAQEGAYDIDGDGLGSFEDGESDGDGITDAEEAVAGTDGFITNANSIDTDNDGLDDDDEIAGVSPWTQTDPTDSDTDNDGYSDGDEVLANTDPNNASSSPGVPVNPILIGIALLAAGTATLRKRK